MKIVVIDGQGGRLGHQLIEELKEAAAGHTLVAIGTNALATSSMLKAGAVQAAHGRKRSLPECTGCGSCSGPYLAFWPQVLCWERSPLGWSRGWTQPGS